MIVFQILILVIGATVPIYSWLDMFKHADRLLGWRDGTYRRLTYTIFCVSGLLIIFLGLLGLVEVLNLGFFAICYVAMAVLGGFEFKTSKAS